MTTARRLNQFIRIALLAGAVGVRPSTHLMGETETAVARPVLDPDQVDAAPLELRHTKNLSLPFLSSVTGNRFGLLTIESIAPATRKKGPFTLPAVGFAIHRPRLALWDTPCTADDWSRLLRTVEAYSRLPSSGQPELQLPDGRLFTAGHRCQIEADTFTALISQPSGGRLLVRIHHDGQDRLHVESRELPVKAPVSLSLTTDNTNS